LRNQAGEDRFSAVRRKRAAEGKFHVDVPFPDFSVFHFAGDVLDPDALDVVESFLGLGDSLFDGIFDARAGRGCKLHDFCDSHPFGLPFSLPAPLCMNGHMLRPAGNKSAWLTR